MALELTGQAIPRGYSGAVEGLPALQGFGAARRNATTQHARRVNEAARLYADTLAGRVDPVFLREAINPRDEILVGWLQERYPGLYKDRTVGLRETMSVTDYQALYVDVLDRVYYGFYNAYPIVNKSLVKITTLRDFRTVKRYMLDGVVTPLTSMDAAAPPPQRALLGADPQDGHPATTTAAVTYAPLLYQAMTSVNWRAFVNDDLGIFQDLANRLAIAGNRGISKSITGLYVDANGPNASLYTANYRNLITTTNGAASNNPPLSSQGVMDALKVLARQRDSGGDPILITGRLKLWYGPALTAVAQNLKNALSLYIQTEGGAASATGGGFPLQMLNTANWIADMDLIMDPYISIVCTTATTQDTMWGITVDPASQNRPNSEWGFLSGFETPQIYTKLPNTQRMGGGVDATLGDFYTMDQEMKIVTVMGGTQIDGRSTVASTGRAS